MSVKRFQNKVSGSRYALPVMLLYTIAVWVLGGAIERQDYLQFAVLMVSTYLMVELNNTNALLNMYSRMVSCSLLGLTGMGLFLFHTYHVSVVILSSILFCTLLFHTYQDDQSQGLTFYAFLFLGITSTAFVQVAFFVPFIWLMMAYFLMAFSFRIWWASILGFLTPYWFALAAALYAGQTDRLLNHVMSITHFEMPFHYEGIPLNEMVTTGFIAALALLGMIHYLSKQRLDRIRTRMIYYFFICIDLLALIFLVLQPQHREQLTGMIMVFTSPLIAHFISHGKTRLSNITFCFILILMVTITAYNLWIYSSNS